jgi:DNA primase
MKHEHMEFREAIEKLASKTGITLPENRGYDRKKTSVTDNLYKINQLAEDFYHKYLKSKEGRKAYEYLTSRGISEAIIDKFFLGYAPDAWERFRIFCVNRNIPGTLLRTAGLTIASEKGKNDYDRFRNRIIFPVRNERSRIVAFGGRVLNNSLPKYINSPDSVIYSKSNVLYGLDQSKRFIREKRFAIIVEGYLDVIMPFQFGIMNIVAASGTSLTPSQVVLLKRYTDTVVMIFDSDSAGEAAALRGLDIMVENNMKVRIATLPENEDPDSFIRKKGKEAFEKVIEKAKDLFDYKLDLLRERYGDKNVTAIVDEMLPTISKIQHAVLQSECVRKLSETLGVHEASLRLEMGKVKTDYSYKSNETIKGPEEKLDYKNSELHLLGLSLLDRKAFITVKNEVGIENFSDGFIREAFNLVDDIYSDGCDEIKISKLISRLEGKKEIHNAVIKSVAEAEITTEQNKVLTDCIIFMKKEIRNETLKKLTRKLKQAQTTNNNDEITSILIKINKIHKEKVV